jgi:5'-AMP-activated protein kinase regulatory gamma subunit
VQEEEKRGGKKGRLLGIITLSDVLRYVIGEVGIGGAVESIEKLPLDNPPSPDVSS